MTGNYVCLLCGFRLTKLLLHASTGNVGISVDNHNTDTDELCPNDGSELVVDES
jgi:predicted RNA-binding Zn-ribbon protein involved in translation (DUF1610 family)